MSQLLIKKQQACYHCGLIVPSNTDFVVVIENVVQAMCCPGCQAVAMAIVDGGLERFYRFRTEKNTTNQSTQFANELKSKTDWSIYDLLEVQNEFVSEYDVDCRQANLLLENISCAACSWLIETHLKKNPAIKIVNVNISTHRCAIVWSVAKIPLSEVMQALDHIGYKPRPATDEQQQALIKKENRIALFRLGVAGFGMMQSMMVAVGIYTGATDAWLDILHWLSMLAATPVVFFSSAPFFKAAWRSIKSRQLIMDVPVALAIGLAYLASAWATITHSGDVYFESVSMFAFFLLLGRYIEQRARHRNRLAFSNIAQLMPLTACCITQESGQEISRNIPLNLLSLNDKVLVKGGDTFPCDGLVISGESEVVEALITGESLPVYKKVGCHVIAGSLNGQSALRIKVTAVGGATQISGIERLATQAADEKPKQVLAADKMARFFVARLLVVCVGVFLFWWFKDPSRALWVTLSVLVVTCPCALALAMPAALSAATANLRKQGFLVARGHVIESLAKITRVMFDKTGTLTEGHFFVVDVKTLGNVSREKILAIAAALETDSNHPVAHAFRQFKTDLNATDTRQFVAAGVEGYIENSLYRLGTLHFSSEIVVDSGLDKTKELLAPPDLQKFWLLLSNTQGAVAWIALEDKIRSSAYHAIAELQAMGIAVELLSGDHTESVAFVAKQLGIQEYCAGVKPAEKLARLSMTQLAGDKVLMIGDGINDVPVLAGADVSVAMASASDLAQTRADSVLLHDQLTVLPAAIKLAERTHRIVMQNLIFSLSYNLIALPLAASGHVPPWAAAIGMSMSSLVVVLNALRLSR